MGSYEIIRYLLTCFCLGLGAAIPLFLVLTVRKVVYNFGAVRGWIILISSTIAITCFGLLFYILFFAPSISFSIMVGVVSIVIGMLSIFTVARCIIGYNKILSQYY
ncbi:hypothetical protein [Terribacillus saccharophilus]|uniref:hypothetical protein n=1 Tax=Terribacillus saccharophilus TaxID=361277 RepID=UPI002989F606|nr:hypothetical protein [Terribacillus saccharophilus]MCM3227520.1 hypothetical protein [Terribacillus saccharophilus]